MSHLDIESIIGDQTYIVHDSVCHALLNPVMHNKDIYFKISKAKIFQNFKLVTVCSEEINCDIYLGIKDLYGNLKILLLQEESVLEIESNMPEDNDKASEYITKITDNLIEDGYLIITGSKTNITKYKLRI